VSLPLLNLGDCTTGTDKRIVDRSGFDFEIFTTRCSGFPSTVYRSVYAAKTGEKVQALLFQYHPNGNDTLPAIAVPAPDRILIVAPWLHAVVARRYQWRGVSIEYNMGKPAFWASPETRLDDSK